VTQDSISLRRAAAADLGAIEALYGQLAPEVWNVARDLPTILDDPHALCLVLEVQGRPLGFVCGYIRTSLSCGRTLTIDEIVVDRDQRGRGYGRALLEYCIRLARERGLECVELACSLARPELHRFYERMGFEDRRMKLYSLFLESK
jgi:GNAT superfamily N-acetyltransferase